MNIYESITAFSTSTTHTYSTGMYATLLYKQIHCLQLQELTKFYSANCRNHYEGCH
jgi:hypothetical protein